MKLFKIIVICIFAFYIAGCSSLSVNYDFNQQIDFSRLKTYNWLPFPKDMKINVLNRARFITAVDNNLASKGMVKNSSKPDFMIATHFGKENKIDVTNWGYSYEPNTYYTGSGYRHPAYYNRASTGGVSVCEYDQGTSILSFIFTITTKLIRRATATAIISTASYYKK